jgi:hypothetical protein
MNVAVATIGALLLLLPGVGFVTGVNLADKNVREIVFRNTPAEIGYVIVVSLVVHLAFAWLPFNFNAGYEVLRYNDLQASKPTADDARLFLRASIGYFLVSAIVGFMPGFALGRLVRQQGISFFAKHRWMLDLVGVRAGDIVYARVLVTPSFTPPNADPSMVLVEGILYDSYFQGDGTLLYLVFRAFREQRKALTEPPYLGSEFDGWPTDSMSNDTDRLVIEGKSISFARYRRYPAKVATDNINRIKKAVSEDFDLTG